MIAEDLRRPAPDASPGVTSKRFGDSPGQPVQFYVFADVLEELVFAARFDERPCFALLSGAFGVAEEAGFIEVTGFDSLKYLANAEDAYQDLRSACDTWILDGDIGDPMVGFFAHVPGSKGVLDEEVARLHMSLFNIPFQLVIVFDSASDKLGLYARPPHGRFVACEFNVVRPASDESE